MDSRKGGGASPLHFGSFCGGLGVQEKKNWGVEGTGIVCQGGGGGLIGGAREEVREAPR